MTPRERAELRNKLARVRLDRELHERVSGQAAVHERLRVASGDVDRAERQLRDARRALLANVRAAHGAGESLASIARTLCVSRQRVAQLLERDARHAVPRRS